MENNKTTSTLEDECETDNDCLFVIGDGFFRVWHVILIAAAIVILILVVVVRCFKCPRLPEEARKKKEKALRRQELEENGTTNVELNTTDGHAVLHVRSSYEGNVDQPLHPPGNVDMPLTPPAASQEVNVVHNPSAGHKPPAARYSRYSHEPSDSVELRYIRSRTTSRTTSEVRDSSYYHENTGAIAESPPTHSHPNTNSSTQFPTVMSTSTRI